MEIVNAKAQFPPDELCNTATDFHFEAIYKSGVKLIVIDNARGGVTFEGKEGWVWADRGNHDANPKSVLWSKIGPEKIHLYAWLWTLPYSPASGPSMQPLAENGMLPTSAFPLSEIRNETSPDVEGGFGRGRGAIDLSLELGGRRTTEKAESSLLHPQRRLRPLRR